VKLTVFVLSCWVVALSVAVVVLCRRVEENRESAGRCAMLLVGWHNDLNEEVVRRDLRLSARLFALEAPLREAPDPRVYFGRRWRLYRIPGPWGLPRHRADYRRCCP
jgi:hypothetical protein